MINKILNKFDFGNPKTGNEVLLFILAVWLMVVACTIWSILSQERSVTWKLIWIGVIVFVPLVGVAAYLPWSLTAETFPLTGRWRDPK